MTLFSFIKKSSKDEILSALESVTTHSMIMRIANYIGQCRLEALTEQMEHSAQEMKEAVEAMREHPGDRSVVERFHTASTAWDKACAAYDRLQSQLERLE